MSMTQYAEQSPFHRSWCLFALTHVDTLFELGAAAMFRAFQQAYRDGEPIVTVGYLALARPG